LIEALLESFFESTFLEVVMALSVNIEIQTKNGSWWGVNLGVPNDHQTIQSEFRNAIKSPMCIKGRARAVNQETGDVVASN
jgi:hypothetical protein